MSDNELLTMLTEQADRLFGDLIDRDLLASVETGTAPAALAVAVDEFGMADALAVPAADGGLTFADAGSLLALFGMHAVPLPIGETLIGRGLLARAGIDAPAGALVLAGRDGESVAFGGAASHVVTERDGRLLLLPAVSLGESGSISRQSRATLDLSVAPVVEAAWPTGLPDPLALGAMLRASQIAGACARVLVLSVEYANVRQQFGRPIGRFQAVQQLLAKLAAEAAAARSAADAAWAALDTGHVGVTHMVAKVRTGEAARAATAIAHQVHGAIGVTDEHILHYFTRRLWEWRLDFGSDVHWAGELGRAARSANDPLWQFLVAACVPHHHKDAA